jgi:hypothetical protein
MSYILTDKVKNNEEIMANAMIHSKSSAKRFGGVAEDYMEIHMKMDCSKAYISSNLHRALTHHSFWIHEVMIPIFGYVLTNSDGKDVAVKDICEVHILEDFMMKYVPTAQDYLEFMTLEDWMQNGIKGVPSSYKKILERQQQKLKGQQTISD